MSSPEVCWPVPMRAIGAQNLLTMPGGVSTAGYLHKKGGSQFSLMKWPLRYIIIHKGCVYYFKSSTSPTPQGAFSLNGYNRVMRAAEETTSSNVFPFKIVHFSKKHRTWFFSAASEDERRKWMRHLRREIDHYNDRKESHIPSDPDTDADSFYGTIEKPMDIKHTESNAEDDYVEEDDEDDEEDYLKPDSDCSPISAAPSGLQYKFPQRPGSSYPITTQRPYFPTPKRPLPSFLPPSVLKDPLKGPPPPLPFAPRPQKPSFSAPPTLPPNPKRTPQSRLMSIQEPGNDKRDWRPLASSVQSPATLPICDQLETRMLLNGPAHCSLNTGGSQSLGNNHHGMMSNLRTKPALPTPNVGGSTIHPPVSPLLKPGHKSGVFKPPPPTVKPPIPAAVSKSKQSGTALQRASPEGQSFRSSGDEAPSEIRGKQDRPGGGDDFDEDYENVQLPDSVFIDTLKPAR
ncbi:hypothetical protein INR49_030312 [Caranx melampygus]|nr:hypothetical protein INR49_030312 [Caranx melampygus]